ncbi:MAG: hypothetical protein HY726_14070 [Candidatus Rokubacteria bacterium]|nr:hypothetical protein [Candidatus Rokubacteria bacterium]
MIAEWRWEILGGGFGLYLVGLGFLVAAVFNQHDQAVKQFRFYLVGPGLVTAAKAEPGDAPWTASVRKVEEALVQNNVSAAEEAWLDAFVAALRSHRWEGLVEVGDAYLRLGKLAGFHEVATMKARRIYSAALFRARQQGSLDGVLRAAEAAAALGDREAAQQGVRIAEGLAAQARDPLARDRVRAVEERLTVPVAGAERREADPF